MSLDELRLLIVGHFGPRDFHSVDALRLSEVPAAIHLVEVDVFGEVHEGDLVLLEFDFFDGGEFGKASLLDVGQFVPFYL